MGIAPRRLWGWEPAEVTKHHYDSAGRLAGSTTTREPEFDVEQREWLSALAELDSDTGQYGEWISEAASDDADPNSKKRRFHYEAGAADAPNLPIINWAEHAVERAQKRYYDKYPDADRAGHMWIVRKVKN
ncbi:hypothetical protein [Arthrobacter sp. UYCu723]